jgi:hypothetical protein
MRRSLLVMTAILAAAAAGPAHAEVIEASDTGFLVKNEAVMNAAPLEVYSALIERIGSWWDPDHTFSGDSRNLSIDPKAGGCFCERLPDNGGVRHLTVVMLRPGRELRLAGALGPLQQDGLAGSMIWRLSDARGSTRVELTYSVGGYRSGGLRDLASPVDSMVRSQLVRLKSFVETGRPN